MKYGAGIYSAFLFGVFLAVPLHAKALFSLQEAVQHTLQNQWGIQVAKEEVELRQGAVEEAKGPFDPIVALDVSQNWWENSTKQLGLTFPEGTTFSLPLVGTVTAEGGGGFRVSGNTTGAELRVKKRIRLGTEFALGVEVNRQKNPFFILEDPYPSFSAFQDEYIRLAKANVFFTIKQPLLRGFIHGRDAASEKKNQLEYQAAKYALAHEISAKLLNTVEAYWDVAGAKQKLRVRKDAIKRLSVYVHDVEKLIEKNQLAKTEKMLPISSLSTAKTNELMAKQQLVVAVQHLQLSMGKAPSSSVEKVVKNNQLDPISVEDSYCNMEQTLRKAPLIALQHRFDIRSLQERKKAAYKQVVGARNDALPDLDLRILGRQTNRNYEQDTSLFAPFSMVSPKREISITLSLNYPLYRSEAKGKLRGFQAEMRQIAFALNREKAAVFSTVIDAIHEMYSLVQERKEADTAEKQARRYVFDQQKLFRAGMTSLFQLIDAETQLVFKEIQHIDVRVRSAKNMARVRFLLGLFIEKKEEGYQIQEIMHLPEELSDLCL